jgi:hypothetical protein
MAAIALAAAKASEAARSDTGQRLAQHVGGRRIDPAAALQKRLDLAGLGDGNGLDDQPLTGVPGEVSQPLQGLLRQVAIDDNVTRLAQALGVGGDDSRRQAIDDRHAVDGDGEFAFIVEHGAIDAGGFPAAQGQRHVDARRLRLAPELFALLILAEPGHQGGAAAGKRQIVGDVAGDTAGRYRHRSGIGGGRFHDTLGPGLDVDIGAANDDGFPALHEYQNVGAPPQPAASTNSSSSGGLYVHRRLPVIGEHLLADGIGRCRFRLATPALLIVTSRR